MSSQHNSNFLEYKGDNIPWVTTKWMANRKVCFAVRITGHFPSTCPDSGEQAIPVLKQEAFCIFSFLYLWTANAEVKRLSYFHANTSSEKSFSLAFNKHLTGPVLHRTAVLLCPDKDSLSEMSFLQS